MVWRVGIDTGGTFTDVIAHEVGTNSWIERKIWSRRDDPGGSLKAALDSLGVPLSEIGSIVYGTTVVTNALIQNNLARVALICTKGFRDVLHIARQRRDVVFGLHAQHRMPPTVPRKLSFEMNERCSVDGEILVPVDEQELSRVMDSIGDSAEVVAISFLHSYKNGANEARVAKYARKAGKYATTSHETSAEAREFERTLVTVLNAGLVPMMSGFLNSISGCGLPLNQVQLFHSAGGMISTSTASRFPILLAMSGPAAGVEAASAVARELGTPLAITFDMGGTTTDCSLLVDGSPEMQMEGHVGKHRVRQPMVAVESIGAGGGSIVRLSNSGLMVGPDSVGSDPGPACYNRGGQVPTITDAMVILGYMGSGSPGARSVSVDRDSALKAYAPVAARLGLSAEETALGALRVANAIAARAIKRITMGRGVDARSCSLLAFGGAGPMIACQLANEIGIRSVVVPSRSSGLSALGCLTANPSFTRTMTVRVKETGFEASAFASLLDGLRKLILDELEGVLTTPYQVETFHSAQMRYAGQSYEIEVPLSSNHVTAAHLRQLFSQKHRDVYGYELQSPWECVAIRTTLSEKYRSGTAPQPESCSDEGADASQTKLFFASSGWRDVPHLKRGGNMRNVSGPAIIADEFSTIVVPPDWNVRGEDAGHIRIEFAGN